LITRSEIRNKSGKKFNAKGKCFSPIKIKAINTETGQSFEYESLSKAGKDLTIHTGNICYALNRE